MRDSKNQGEGLIIGEVDNKTRHWIGMRDGWKKQERNKKREQKEGLNAHEKNRETKKGNKWINKWLRIF